MPPTNAGVLDPAAVAAAMGQLTAALTGEKSVGPSGWPTAFRHDAPGSPGAAGYAHGPGGLLSFPGLDPQVFQTIVGVRPGVLGEIPTRPSVFTDPVYEILTGVQTNTGTNKVDVCDDAPVAGLTKGGKVSIPFGRYEFSTRELELNRMGQRNDRADPVDLRIVGNAIPSGSIFGVDQTMPQNVLTNEMEKAFFERNVFAHRTLAQQVWVGTPANNSAGGGYKELVGLQSQVNTGYVDAETGVALPSLDSDVKDANFTCIDRDADSIIDAITYLYRFVRTLASQTGVDPVRWMFAMREELWYELTKVWPCAYFLGGCTVVDASGQRIVIDAKDQIDLRDQMRQGRFLLIDGVKVDVILDDGIPELTAGDSASIDEGCFASDIFLLPMSVLGGTATLLLEHFDFENASIQSAISSMVIAQTRTGGAWIDTVRQTNWCLQWQMKIEPRLILRTPWLAGRLNNVCYCPLQHTREPFPSDPYFVDGGETQRPGPSYFSLWQS